MLAFWGHYLVLSIKLTHDDLREGPKWSNSIFLVQFYKKYVSYTCLSWYKMIISILNKCWMLVLLICIWYPDGRPWHNVYTLYHNHLWISGTSQFLVDKNIYVFLRFEKKSSFPIYLQSYSFKIVLILAKNIYNIYIFKPK